MAVNLLEKQIEEVLKGKGWEIASNLYYKDPLTGKPREKDTIATITQLKENSVLAYNARLFIECKEFSSPTEIYLLEKENAELKNTLLAYGLFLAKIQEIERFKKPHFYKYKEIFSPKDSQDVLYPAINQNLQSFDAFRKNNNERGLYFLSIIYKGNIQYKDTNNIQKDCDRGIIKIQTIDDVFNLPNKQCLVELVSIDKLEEYLNDVFDDIKKINESIIFYYHAEQRRIEENRKRRFNQYI